MMDSGRAVASSDAVAASMVGLVRGFTLVFHSGDGLAEGGGGPLEFAHKALSLDCARKSMMAVGEAQGLVQSSSVCTSLLML
jgi:hypothetical protein